MYTILHLSDLHRSADEPVTNHSLIAALLEDQERYCRETPVIPPPSAIIVSGDIIQGARLGEANWRDTISSQYEVAEDFLDQLARRFLGGDRSRLIVVPGNHDVCWNTSLAAMEAVAEVDYPRDVYNELIRPNSQYRWSWKDRKLLRVVNQQLYSQRLDQYWDFAERFYRNVALPTPISREQPFQLFELGNRQIVVAAFASTDGNDCFRYSAAIPSDAVSRVNLHLRDIGHDYKLRIAVWHHSVQGPPSHNDYLDAVQVQEMAGLRFQLGVHGHQHVAAATTHYVYLGESKAMAVVSAGSLCAGARELPRGVNRQYNLIVVDDEFSSARVHVREMAEGLQFASKRAGAFSQGYVDVAWQGNTNYLDQTIDIDARNDSRSIFAAEDALRGDDPGRALDILGDIPSQRGGHARVIAIQAGLKLGDWPRLIELIGSPQNIEESVWLVTAYMNAGDLDKAESYLDSSEIDHATRQALITQIQSKRILRQK